MIPSRALRSPLLAAAPVSLVLVACAATVTTNDTASDAGNVDAGPAPFPAFPVDVPQILNTANAPIQANPVFVTITWPGDPLTPTIEDFSDKLGTTSYWRTVVGEYGVGDGTSGRGHHVHLPAASPATISPQDIVDLVKSSVAAADSADGGAPIADAGADGGSDDAGSTSAWPAPTPDTTYAVFLAPGTSFFDGSLDLCKEGIGGYHDNVVVNGKFVAFAVIPRCPGFQDSDVEESAGHEFLEAATDPFPSGDMPTTPPVFAYAGFDADHFAWEVWNDFQDELGDACESFKESYYQEAAPFPYWVQRSWSNKGAKAGHDPCAPRPSSPYYDVTLFPDQEATITVDLTAANDTSHTTRGFKAALNESVSFDVGFFSDADTGGAFTLSGSVDPRLPLADGAGNPFGNGAATVTIDRPTGRNGDKARVTVTPTQAGAMNFQLLVITASLPNAPSKHYLPILIQNR